MRHKRFDEEKTKSFCLSFLENRRQHENFPVSEFLGKEIKCWCIRSVFFYEKTIRICLRVGWRVRRKKIGGISEKIQLQ